MKQRQPNQRRARQKSNGQESTNAALFQRGRGFLRREICTRTPENRAGRRAAPLILLLCATAFAQIATDVQRCEDFERYRHIRTTEPLPNGPLRRDDILDEEVREVQQAAIEVYPDFIVYISGVTNGCNCEEGGSCTAQIWLALNRENQTRSLVLSKIDGHWKIGAVQSWLLEYDAHKASFLGYGRGAKQVAWQQENQRLLDNFPSCPTVAAEWTLVRSDGHFSKCVDMSSIKVSGSIRRVNFKSIYPPQKQIPGFPRIKYTTNLRAFDCKDHRERIDQMNFYYDDGTVTKYPGEDPVLWNPIRPDTVSAADLDLICGWRGK